MSSVGFKAVVQRASPAERLRSLLGRERMGFHKHHTGNVKQVAVGNDTEKT